LDSPRGEFERSRAASLGADGADNVSTRLEGPGAGPRTHNARSLLDQKIEQRPINDLKLGDRDGPGNELALDLPVSLRRRGVETRLIFGEAGTAVTAPDPKLVKLLGQAQQWHAELRFERELSLNALAERHSVDSGDISRILPFAFLAPDVSEAILEGRQPTELTAARLNRMNKLPLSWARQRDPARLHLSRSWS
jgi:hypothetical protein